jgi:SMI1 / KNR4 family (SUKH-1)
MKPAFDPLLTRMTQLGVANRINMRGCSRAEIAFLEKRYGLALPSSYRCYLELMGHQSGRLFTSDHIAALYNHVCDLTDDFRIRRLGSGEEQRTGNMRAPSTFHLPTDALIVAGRLDAAWQFIRCRDADDSPVWTFDEDTWEIAETHASVLDWLITWCGVAEDAIASGYFRTYPKGTTP